MQENEQKALSEQQVSVLLFACADWANDTAEFSRTDHIPLVFYEPASIVLLD